MTPQLVREALVIALVAVAAYTDLRWTKIYNAATAPVIAAGLLLNALWGSDVGLLGAVEGVALALGLFMLSQVCGGCMGGGDIKLLAAIGAVGGARFLLLSFCAATVIGALMAIVTALRHRQLIATCSRCLACGACRLGTGTAVPLDTGEGSLRIPYAVAIAGGVLACLAWSGGAGMWSP